MNFEATVFNHYISTETKTDAYQRTILRGVHWEMSKASDTIRGGTESADTASCYIPRLVDSSGRAFLKPKAFLRTPDDQKQKYWTLRLEDKIVQGAVREDYGAVKKLESDHEDVFTLTKIDTNFYGSKDMWHWKVGGR